jgi:hypothetical protein
MMQFPSEHISIRVPKNVILAKCYYQIGKEDSSLIHFSKAFSYGYNMQFLDSADYATMWHDLKKVYRVQHKKYMQSIHQSVRDSLISMLDKDQGIRYLIREKGRTPELQHEIERIGDENTVLLDEIISHHGWPGELLVGDGNGSRQITPSIIVIHGSEVENKKYLPYIIESAGQGKTRWSQAYNVAQNQMWRYRDDKKRIKMRNTFVHEGKLDIRKSYLELHSLATILHGTRYPWPTYQPPTYTFDNGMNLKCRFFVTKFPDESEEEAAKALPALKELRQFMIDSLFVSPEKVWVTDSLVNVTEDNLGRYRFGFYSLRN